MEHRIFISDPVCYNRVVPDIVEKKSEQVLVNLAPAHRQRVEEIAAAEDRKLGYVVRELFLRGLALYEQDRKLRVGDEMLKTQTVPVLKRRAK